MYGGPHGKHWTGNVDKSKPKVYECIKKTVFENHPDLDTRIAIQFVWFLGSRDPHHDRGLRDHKGAHPAILLGCAKLESYATLAPLVISTSGTIIDHTRSHWVISFKKERHRSQAMRRLWSHCSRDWNPS